MNLLLIILMVFLVVTLKNKKYIEKFDSEKININYDNVNSFRLNELQLLFFDIFARNNELIIIAPVYCDLAINYDEVEIKFADTKLKLKEKLDFIEWEPTIIRIYDLSDFKIDNKKKLDINVSYQKYQKKFTIEYNIFSQKYNFVLSTLFKNDDYLLNTWINYYKKQKVDYFYLYVNKKIDKDYSSFTNCKFIEWDFEYWYDISKYKCKEVYVSHHFAQMGQISQFIYKYAKPLSKWMANIDLDEYLQVENKKIGDILLDKYNYIYFNNYWSKLKDNYIPKYKEKLNLYHQDICVMNNDKLIGRERFKFIVKTSDILANGIHKIKKIRNEKKINYPDSKMIHFKNWSNPGRTISECSNIKIV